MRQMRLFDRQALAAIAQVALTLGLVDRIVRERAAPRALPSGFLERAAFRDPVVQLVAVEEVVGAVGQRRGRAAFEVQEGRAVAVGRPRRVEGVDMRAQRCAPVRGERAHDLDLVRHLVEGDAAAERGVETRRAAAGGRGSPCS